MVGRFDLVGVSCSRAWFFLLASQACDLCSIAEVSAGMMLRRGGKYAEEAGSRRTTLFGASGLFVGSGGKSSPESDPARSPTSPLDYKLFSPGNPFLLSPRADAPRRSWECERARPGLANALLDRSGSGGILVGNQVRINISTPRNIAGSPPKSPAAEREAVSCGSSASLLRLRAAQFGSGELGKIRSCFAEFGRQSFPSRRELACISSKSSEGFAVETVIANVAPVEKLVESPSTSEMEDSEDYTRITTHGPNPKITHIYGDRVIVRGPSELLNSNERVSGVEPASSWFLIADPELETTTNSPPAPDFLSFCFSCRKKLEGQDIYMYRGEKAFCSEDCREELISAEERDVKFPGPHSQRHGEAFHECMEGSARLRLR